jgi:ComF family protein
VYRDGLELLLQAFKFRRHDFLDRPLTDLLVERWESWPARAFDVAVPVPLHPRRLRERGYNQAELLARHFSKRTGIPIEPRLLVKTADTAPQSTLRREQRMRNVRRAFRVAGTARGTRVLLIDDVCTTGSTLRSSAAALRRAGAESVTALVVARA